MKALLICLFVPICLCLRSQQINPAANKPGTTGNTYAVIVGVSNYESPGIPQLQFAHRDAQVFADYLQSKAGGTVPSDHIRLLLNEQATYGAIYEALGWLLASCQANDLVYFYFSGHGDMENSTIYQLGFLLSYNTPRTNYINNAVRIEDLNNIANTLSVKMNAKVVLITDACHSGKLAGADNRGTFLVGNQLRTVQSKEIRITSCAPDQLSAEDEGWGGGRGVFSYYLLNGLEGMADADKNEAVTVTEIKSYLDSSLANDALLAQKAIKQQPVISGNNGFTLSAVDKLALTSIRRPSPLVMRAADGSPAPPMVGLAPLPVQPQTLFFDVLKQRNPEESFNFTVLDKLPKEEIAFACVHMMTDSAQPGTDDAAKMKQLEKTLRENKDALVRFNSKLAVMLNDRTQEVINHYLEGDAAELERRRYYNSRNNGYDVYPLMLSVALKLTAPQDYFYHIIEVKLHYFSGVALRLKIPTVENPGPLIDAALAEEQKAFQLEENAAYIQNELGVLYLMKDDPQKAAKYFARAIEIAPQWAIPQTNMAGLYIDTRQYEKAIAAAKTAQALQPDLQGVYVSRAWAYEKQGRLLLAEEAFRKSIELNSRHYLPFERLGYVYMNTTQYALADSFFYEADKRKKGFHFNDRLNRYPPVMMDMAASPGVECQFDKADVGKADVMGHVALGLHAYGLNDTAAAEVYFKEAIAIDKSNPLAFHYLGKLLYEHQHWQEAAIILGYALQYFLDHEAFIHYCDSATNALPETKSKKCISHIFRNAAYPQIDDYYLAGRMYERWDHLDEAERFYRDIIRLQPAYTGGYYLLWSMLEKTGRYLEAEQVVQRYAANGMYGLDELPAFYRRMLAIFPDDAAWLYKAGICFHRLCAERPEYYPFDKKYFRPDSHEERYFVGDPFKPAIVQPLAHAEIMPAIGESIHFSALTIYPRTEGIACLKKADSLLSADSNAVAAINEKLGDLYVWQGLSANAYSCYEKSLEMRPANAGNRLKLADIYNAGYRFSEASIQLDSLYNSREIDFRQQLLLAKYRVHERRFTDAEKLLRDAVHVHPYKIAEIADLYGRMNLLAGRPKQAIGYYENYLALVPRDSSALYSIARAYSVLGQTAEAWKWLAAAIDQGFVYSWVLRFDPVWDRYRKQPQWAKLQHSYQAKEYKIDNAEQ